MLKVQNQEEGEIKMEEGEIFAGKQRKVESQKEEGEIIENKTKYLRQNLNSLKCKHCTFTQPVSDTLSIFAQNVLCPVARFRRHITREHMRCYICEEPFLHKIELQDHDISVHRLNENYLTCNNNKCVFTSKTVSYMFRHSLSVHQGIELFKCNQCNNSFDSIPTLKEHLRKHKKTKI